jgi:hypothetical protein
MNLYSTRKSNPSLNATTTVIVGFLLVVPPQFATAADLINSGTIIVIAQTKHRIIIAADSRVESPLTASLLKVSTIMRARSLHLDVTSYSLLLES